MAVLAGVDVGGTFTDVVAYDEGSGRVWALKVPTTPRDPARGVLEGLRGALGSPGRAGLLVHATTLGTNLFLGQVGLEPPRVALFTNRGFRDVLEIGRQNRPSLYDPRAERPRPLVPRERRVGVPGRLGPRGEELEPIDTGMVERLARYWCERGVRVFAVSFLHSYANPEHERRAGEAIRRACPGSVVVLSSDVDPQPMEYERTSTTVVNAVLRPLLGGYLERLEGLLRGEGFRGPILVMQSSGGVAGLREALERPAAFIESGPSAGAVAVAYLAARHGVERALGFDMGGTTAKASSIVGGRPLLVDMIEVGGRVHMGRPVPGSGYPVRYPHIDLAEVSAGGGTIAWVDPGGALRVGPESAGSRPGPACYGRGGDRPTVTDALLLLGRLPERLAGGLVLRRDLAERAVRRWVAQPLGLDPVEAALAIVGLANTVMAGALRIVTLERGLDPRGFTMYAYGGAGPLHAAELAEQLGIGRIIVPPLAGVFSALGLLLADFRVSLHAPIVESAGRVDEERLYRVFQGLEERAHRILDRWRVPPEARAVERYVEARYQGQAYTLRVPYRGSIGGLVEEFHRLHEARYGFSAPGEPVELVTARLEAVGLRRKPPLRAEPEPGEPLLGERMVHTGGSWRRAPVLARERLPPGYRDRGPLIVEARDTTVLVPPGWGVRVLGDGSILMER